MWLTLALVVCGAAIFVLFTDEFKRLFKKIFDYQFSLIVLPLIAASWIVSTFDYVFVLGITDYLNWLKTILYQVTMRLPAFPGLHSLATVLLITVIAVLPLVVIDLFCTIKSYRPYQYPYITSTLIWLITAMVWLLG